jgi:hypothetical protein
MGSCITRILILCAVCSTMSLWWARNADAADSVSPRKFQMTMYGNREGVDAELKMFSEGEPQPDGLSVMAYDQWRTTNSVSYLRDRGYDWSRIVAAVVDEPYWFFGGGIEKHPCETPGDGRSDTFLKDVAEYLRTSETSLHTVSRSTRFWINFSLPEVEWIRDRDGRRRDAPSVKACKELLSKTMLANYIDVISFDWYEQPFKLLKPKYEWLWNHRSAKHQQLALLPGLHYRKAVDTCGPCAQPCDGAAKDNCAQFKTGPETMASYLLGYFQYANRKNRKCNLDLGEIGETGHYDGCPVWTVQGYTYQTSMADLANAEQLTGYSDPRSVSIQSAWRRQLGVSKSYSRTVPKSSSPKR